MNETQQKQDELKRRKQAMQQNRSTTTMSHVFMEFLFLTIL